MSAQRTAQFYAVLSLLAAVEGDVPRMSAEDKQFIRESFPQIIAAFNRTLVALGPAPTGA